MKLVFLVGDCATGKMTVGQKLAECTGLKLFHNHMTIEPVIELFDTYDRKCVSRLREVIFEEFAASEQYGMIFTFLWAFDEQEDWDYIAHVQDIFRPYNTDFYCVELDAPLEVRLQRNNTQNRLAHKPSKRDVEASNDRLIGVSRKYRCVSKEGEVPFAAYLRINNAEVSAEEAARMIKEKFGL